ncbi:unnamed protein product [Rhodiola kirilowii]
MALVKPIFFLRAALTKSTTVHALRLLSFATPEEAAAARRNRNEHLGIQSPGSNCQTQPQPPNPNAPKIPEPTSALSGPLLVLHNKVLNLVRENDLDEAAEFTRHSIYSNCRPTVYTVNAVLAALARQRRYIDFMSLHRFVVQAGVVPNIVTHNLLLSAYCDRHKMSAALDHYKQLVNYAPFSPSPTTYRILIKGVVDSGDELRKAVELKDDMLKKGLMVDAKVYSYLMEGYLKNLDAEGALEVYEELKEKLGVGADGVVEDGVVYGSWMKVYALRGMGKEAMDLYKVAVGENSKVKMNVDAYNSVLEALIENSEFDEALRLFDRMMDEHNPPRKLKVNCGSFFVMANGYCELGKSKEAIEIFRRMDQKRCFPETLTFNNLIEKLCNKGMLAEGEELFGDMNEKGVKPDENTYILLMDVCFKSDRADDAAEYYMKMVKSGLGENLVVFKKLATGLIQAGKVDKAKSFFDMMVKRFRMDSTSYEIIMKALSDSGKLNDVIQIVDGMLDEEVIVLDENMKDFVKGILSKEGREDELEKLIHEKERIKAEAKAKEAEEAERIKEQTRAAVASLTAST